MIRKRIIRTKKTETSSVKKEVVCVPLANSFLNLREYKGKYLLSFFIVLLLFVSSSFLIIIRMPPNDFAPPFPNASFIKAYNDSYCEEFLPLANSDPNQRSDFSSFPSFGNDFIEGSTGRRFGINKLGSGFISLSIDDPSTYRAGVHSIWKKLVQASYNKQFALHFKVYDKFALSQPEEFEHHLNKLKTILAKHPTFCQQSMPSLYALRIFKMVGRLDEIDTAPLIGLLLSHQKEDGGFNYSADDFGRTKDTAEFVTTLASLGVDPLNISGVASFLTSMQNLEPLWDYQQGFFCDHPQTWGVNSFATCRALETFQTLHLPIPHKEVIENTTQRIFQERFLDFYDKANWSDWSDQMTLNAQFYFSVVADLAFCLRDYDFLHRLKSYGWEILSTLPEKLITQEPATTLMFALDLVGKACFPPRILLSPGRFSFSNRHPHQSFTLRLNNTTPLVHQLRFNQLLLDDSFPFTLSVEGLPTGVFTLDSWGTLDFPLKITIHNSASLNRKDIPNLLPLKLVVERLAYGMAASASSMEYWVSSDIYFNLPVKKSLSGLALGLIIGGCVLSIATATIIVFYKTRKRSNLNQE
jgi:hypothetical protein